MEQRSERYFVSEGRKNIFLLEVFQAGIVCPDKDRMRVENLGR
jgi:hypothetical protein